MQTRDLNTTLLRITRRAENADPAMLVKTFVDIGPLFTLLASADHQVLYGRRGTGKTHALLYLAQTRATAGDIAVYIDMRTIGSTGGLYSDTSVPIPERATRLLMDTLNAIHNSILDAVLSPGAQFNLALVGARLDALASAASEVQVVGTVTREQASTVTAGSDEKKTLIGQIATGGLNVGASIGGERSRSSQFSTTQTESGQIRHRVHFGSVGRALEGVADAVNPKRIWIILDEWSVVPIDLQPFLADLVRRSLFPVNGIVVKIGAIEQRANFQLIGERGDYVGIELGADVSADVNLDDFMVFENDARRATAFFQELLYRHFEAAAEEAHLGRLFGNSGDLVRAAFTQRNAFEEFVRASEGVPRDAINIIGLAAQRALDVAITTEHIRSAAKTWYQRDKEAAVAANTEAREFLHWIVEEVIAHRRARAFLLESRIRHPLIDALFDARVLHLCGAPQFWSS